LPLRVVNENELAGRPVSGGPLFCGRSFFWQYFRFFRVIGWVIGRVTGKLLGALLGLSLCIVGGLNSATANTLGPSHSDYNCAYQSTDRAANSAANEAANKTAIQGERVTVEAATDGDTVVLKDGRRVRIIGINAAELSKKSERALKQEATEARDIITSLISEADYLTLVYGNEAQDRYGRVLAHLLLPNGQSLASEVLARGLAAATAVSPNTRCAEHYYRIERAARGQKKGLWQHTDNPWFGNNVGTNSIQGFHILTTQIKSITLKRSRWHIELTNDVMVYSNLSLISESESKEWVGKNVEVRGWFGRRNGRTSVSLHHRQNLFLLQ